MSSKFHCGVLGLALLWGCDRAPEPQCSFEQSHAIGHSTGARFDALKLLRWGGGLLAFWSGDDGTWARPLDARGAPQAPAKRIFAQCGGGLSALPLQPNTLPPAGLHFDAEPRIAVACATSPRQALGSAGAVVLLWLDAELNVLAQSVHGSSGRDSQGVALGTYEATAEQAQRRPAIEVLWHDGTPGAWTVFRARPSDPEFGASALSNPERAAGPPEVISIDGTLWRTWAETWIDAGFPAGRVMVQVGEGEAIPVAEVNVSAPRPTLATDEAGAVLLFRDFRRSFRRRALFAQRLGSDGDPSGEPEWLSRANARGGPVGFGCGDHLATLSPRSFDEDVLIGVNIVDQALDRPVPQQQIYQWASQFELADGTCSDGAIMTLMGSRGQPPGAGADLLLMPLRCETPER